MLSFRNRLPTAHPLSLTTATLCSVSQSLLQTCYMKGIIQHVTCGIGLPTSQHNSLKSHSNCYVYQ